MRISHVFRRNLGMKLLALVLAIFLWFMAVGREMGEIGLNVPLELVNFPPDMVVANQVPDGISVRIRGAVALTRQIAERKLRFSLNLAGAKTGSNTFPLTTDQLDLPRGMEVTRLAPTQVTVELEQLENKTLSLLPVIKGEPRSGYIIEDMNLDPKQVTIRGPASVVSALGILWTEPIDVNNLDRSLVVDTRPALPDVALSIVQPQTVKARIKVLEKIGTRTFTDVPVEAINAVKSFKLNPETVDLTVRGPVNTLADMVVGREINMRVNLSGLGAGVQDRLLIIGLPPNVEVVKVDPKVIEVEIFEDRPIGAKKTPKPGGVNPGADTEKEKAGNEQQRKTTFWH